jgi:hypothetical protein
LVFHAPKAKKYPLIDPKRLRKASYQHSGVLQLNVATIFASKAALQAAIHAASTIRSVSAQEAKLEGLMERYIAYLNRGVLNKSLTAADAQTLSAQAQAKVDKARKAMGLRKQEATAAAPVAGTSEAEALLRSLKKNGSVAGSGASSLVSPRRKSVVVDSNGKTTEADAVHPEEYLLFRIRASSLPKGDVFGNTDSFVELQCRHDGNWTPVLASEVIPGARNAQYGPIACKAKELFSPADPSMPVRVCVWQRHRNKAPTLLGEAQSTLDVLKQAGGNTNSNGSPKYGVALMDKKKRQAAGIGSVPDDLDWEACATEAGLAAGPDALVLPLIPAHKKKPAHVIFERVDVMHDKIARRTLQAISMAKVGENRLTDKDAQKLDTAEQELLPELLSMRSARPELMSMRSVGSNAESRRSRR